MLVLPDVELSPCLASPSSLLSAEVEPPSWGGSVRLVVMGVDLDEDAMPDC